MKLEDKIRFFAHFMFCIVKSKEHTFVLQSIDGDTGCAISPDKTIQVPIEECKLALKPLTMLRIKDAAKCAELANLPAALYKNWQVKADYCGVVYFSWPGEECPNYRNNIQFTEDKLNHRQIDYLRSQGYAIGVPKELYTTDTIILE
jgi:hypothetical protein